MKCIVIDDEKPAVDLICSYIEKVPFLELAGSFTGVGKAITSVMSCPVDLIFSDIELNADINGIQLMKSLPDPPMVIFVSAFGRYAVDYLMKPVSYERFIAAVNKAYRQFSARASADATASGAPSPSQAQSQRTDFIFIKMENRLVKVYLTEILYIKGYGDYVKIYMTGGRVLLSLQSLNKLETLLPENFVRVHRSFIIALDKISEIEHRRIKIDQELIPIGESYLDRFFGLVLPQGREKP